MTSLAVLAGLIAAGIVACGSTGGQPTVERELQAHPYVSVSGMDGGKSLKWLGDTPLKLSFKQVDGRFTAIVETPCNTVNQAFEIRNDHLEPDAEHFSAGAEGCLGEIGNRQKWATEFFQRDLSFSQKERVLTLRTGTSVIAFRRNS